MMVTNDWEIESGVFVGIESFCYQENGLLDVFNEKFKWVEVFL